MRYVYAVAIALALATMAPPAAASAGPSRVCPVKGGYVQLQGGIMKDTAAPLTLPIGKLKYPTRYFVNVVNRSRAALWIEINWTFPGKEEGRPFRSKKVASDESSLMWKASLGVIEETPIGIHLRFYEDDRFRRLIGETRRQLVFGKGDVAAFKGAFWKTGGSVILSGWPDDEDTANKVPGTAAGAQLQADILGRLAAFEMTERPDYRMEALRAESFEPEVSAVLAKLEGEPKVVAEHRIKEGSARWERWTVRSCDTEVAYEVLGTASPEGGTDLAVAPIPAIPATPDAIEAPPGQRDDDNHIDALRRPAPTAPVEAGAAIALVPEESLKDQIKLSIPAGWSAFEQTRLLTGSPGPLGIVLYSSTSFEFSGQGGSKADEEWQEMLKRTLTGEIPMLHLDRIPAVRGAACKGFTAAAQAKILKMVREQDEMFSPSYTVLDAPRGEPVRLPRANGLRVRGRSRDSGGVEWELDIIAVADGKTVYLLYGRAKTLFIGRSSEILELVAPTITLTRCGGPR